MTPHSIFYYPYASLIEEQSVLLKAAALYFDKLYILDPMKARFNRIHIDEVEQDMVQLEQEELLVRLEPEKILKEHEPTITAAIQRDLKDEEFKRLCAESGGRAWTLALAKVPEHLRQNPAHQPLEESMQRVLSLRKSKEDRDGFYDENRNPEERKTLRYDYRFIDQNKYAFEFGEAIMLNHALVGGLLHTGAIPITDEEVHSSILNYKIRQAQQQVPEIRAIVADQQERLNLASDKLAARALRDHNLGVIPEKMPLKEILDYRRRYAGELQEARTKMQWLAQEIMHQPWTQEFEDEVFHKAIPELQKALGPVQNSWSAWKAAKYGLLGTAAFLGMFANPGISVPVVAAAVLPVVAEGLDDWQQGKTQNGFHYLLRLKRNY